MSSEQIIIYDIPKLNQAISTIVECINYRDRDYTEVKEIVEAVETLKLSFITLNKLQEMIKEAQKQKQNDDNMMTEV